MKECDLGRKERRLFEKILGRGGGREGGKE
jgi:hypothetical protein